ncbi:MAG: peptidoglycan DD-metalloendopeptidase family protein [Thermodesulfovibrionales bacterium]|nr:peptidoglycan DD-metalloendopeptidase family protein [Thermodesulfovibrionales bacterium]
MYNRNCYSSALFYFLLLSFMIAFLLWFSFDNLVVARSPQEEYKQIQEQMKIHKKKLESTKKTEKNILEELRKLNLELAEIEKKLQLQRDKITDLQNNIRELNSEIKSYNEKLSHQKRLLKKRIKAIQRMAYENEPILVILSAEDPDQILKVIRYLRDISEYDKSLIKRYQTTINLLRQKVSKLQAFEAELQKEEESYRKLEASHKEQKVQKEKLLVSVKKEKSYYENMIKELKEASNRIMQIIEEANRKERELKKKKGEVKAPVREEDLPEYSAFTKLKGKLNWPVVGTIAIPYGSQTDPIFNLPVFRSGIHIKTSPNSQVKAVYEGKVVFADSFKGFGQLVIVSHGGGYHTLYGNLSRIFPKNGAIIQERELIGETGESQLLGTYGLYFEIRYKGRALNPEHWLKKVG